MQRYCSAPSIQHPKHKKRRFIPFPCSYSDMYFSGWTDTSEPSTLSSGWVDSFAWHSNEVDGRDPSKDDRGTFVIWVRSDGELRKYAYDNEPRVPYHVFAGLRAVTESGDERRSVGAHYNRMIKENEDIAHATLMGEETAKITPASED